MFKKLMLSCFKATELIEKSTVVRLSSIERFQLKIHLSVCDVCKQYKGQSELIDKAIATHTTTSDITEDDIVKFEDALVKKIKSGNSCK